MISKELAKKGFVTKGEKVDFNKQNTEIDKKFKKIIESKGILKK